MERDRPPPSLPSLQLRTRTSNILPQSVKTCQSLSLVGADSPAQLTMKRHAAMEQVCEQHRSDRTSVRTDQRSMHNLLMFRAHTHRGPQEQRAAVPRQRQQPLPLWQQRQARQLLPRRRRRGRPRIITAAQTCAWRKLRPGQLYEHLCARPCSS